MKTYENSFWEKVIRGKPNECWEWQGSLHDGYGAIRRVKNGKHLPIVFTHRLSWEIHLGPIPDGLCICHKCDNRKCVNPHHLFLGTNKDNTMDAQVKGRLASGEKIKQSKLNKELVIWLRKLWDNKHNKHNFSSLARQFGVTERTIAWAIRGVTWKHI